MEDKPDKNPKPDPKTENREPLQGTAITTTGPDGTVFHKETGFVVKQGKRFDDVEK